MSSYLRIYKDDNFNLRYQTYNHNELDKALTDKIMQGGHIIREIGVCDEA